MELFTDLVESKTLPGLTEDSARFYHIELWQHQTKAF